MIRQELSLQIWTSSAYPPRFGRSDALSTLVIGGLLINRWATREDENQDPETMKGEAIRKTRSWIILLCSLAVVVAALFLGRTLRPKEDVVTFRIIDRSSRQPITNVHLLLVQRWTPVPIERVKLPFFPMWRTQEVVSAAGTIKVPVRKKVSQMIAFRAAGYHGAMFADETSEWWSILYEPSDKRVWGRHEQLFRTNKDEVVVELQRRLAVYGFPR